MASNEVLSERRGHGLIVTFNRPGHGNGLTLDMANQLFLILKNVTTDRSVRAVLLCGAGGSFMAGADMGGFAGDFNAGLEKANQTILPYHSSIRELQAMDKPVLAVVEGTVSGAGLSFMLACDLVMAARSARFVCDATGYASTPDGGLTAFLPRKIGLSRALELMMLAETFDAGEAERLHLVNRVVEDARLQEESLAWFDRLAEGPTKAYGAVKKLAAKAFEQDLNAQLGLEHTYLGHAMRSFDFREALKARQTDRAPKYSGA